MKIRLAETGRQQLTDLMQATGAGSLLVLRFALVCALKLPSNPTVSLVTTEALTVLTVDWHDFVQSGSDQEDYDVGCKFVHLLKLAAHAEGILLGKTNLESYLNLQIHRGLQFLASTDRVYNEGIVGLVNLVSEFYEHGREADELFHLTQTQGGLPARIHCIALVRHTETLPDGDLKLATHSQMSRVVDVSLGDRLMQTVIFLDRVVQTTTKNYDSTPKIV